MSSDLLITGIRHLVTTRGTGAARGAGMRDLDIIDDAVMAVSDGRITYAGKHSGWWGKAGAEFDLGGASIVPALVDPHTHAIWAGNRLDDFDARTSGVAYETILARGGGIHSSIAATAATSSSALAELAAPRIARLLASGATTIEVKSGYGFSLEGELASLEAIRLLAQRTPATIAPTLLIHVPPRDKTERADHIAMVTKRLMPEVKQRGLAAAVDIFIEKESFTVEEARLVFRAARQLGMPLKAHVDQFHAIGGLELALEFSALSVDHLEASRAEQVTVLAESGTVGVLLPGVTLHLGLRAAPGRALIDAGAAVAVGTDLNPGSSPLFSAQMAMALAVRLNGLTAAEALTAATANGAAALGLADAGRLANGQRADFLVLSTHDWRDLPYTLGASPVERVFIGGREVTQ